MVKIENHADILYGTENAAGVSFLNLFRVSKFDPSALLYEVKGIPTQKPRRVEVLRTVKEVVTDKKLGP
jgi:hypothetical protein